MQYQELRRGESNGLQRRLESPLQCMRNPEQAEHSALPVADRVRIDWQLEVSSIIHDMNYTSNQPSVNPQSAFVAVDRVTDGHPTRLGEQSAPR